MEKRVRKKFVIIYPEKATLVAKILKLNMKGYSDYKIARELGWGKPRRHGLQLPPTPTGVRRILEHADEDLPRIRRYIKTIEHVGYLALKHRRSLSSSEIHERAEARIFELLSASVPLAVGNAIGGRAVGYRQVKRRIKVEKPKSHGSKDRFETHSVIEVNPEKRQTAVDIFQTFHDGGNMSQLFRDHGLPQSRRRNVKRMIANKLYIGRIVYKGHEFHFKELAIIDETTWKECQQPKDSKRRFTGAKPRYGFVRKAGSWKKTEDPQVAQKIKNVITRRTNAESYTQIAGNEDLDFRTVYGICNDPIYAGKVYVDGKYEDAGVQGFMPLTDWKRAHDTSAGLRSYEASRETRRGMRDKKMRNILDFIKEHPEGVHWTDLLRRDWPCGSGRSKKYGKTALANYIRMLELGTSDGKIEKRDKKLYFIETAST